MAHLIRTVAKLLDEDTVEYVHRLLLEDLYDNDTRETVCEILMEALSSQFDVDGVDGAALCDSLFMLLDVYKQ